MCFNIIPYCCKLLNYYLFIYILYHLNLLFIYVKPLFSFLIIFFKVNLFLNLPFNSTIQINN